VMTRDNTALLPGAETATSPGRARRSPETPAIGSGPSPRPSVSRAEVGADRGVPVSYDLGTRKTGSTGILQEGRGDRGRDVGGRQGEAAQTPEVATSPGRAGRSPETPEWGLGLRTVRDGGRQTPRSPGARAAQWLGVVVAVMVAGVVVGPGLV
jgi:hypothetical protein